MPVVSGARKRLVNMQQWAAMFFCLAFGMLMGAARAGVVVYPAPSGETLSTDYQVWIDGKKADIFAARVLDPPFADKQWDYGGPYAFTNFDMSGHATVRIVARKSLQHVVVRPESAGINPRMTNDHEITFTVDKPIKVSIEPDGKKGPLLLFANPLELDPPTPGDKHVRYFGPGVHHVGRVDIGSGETVYLAGGAVLKGAIVAKGQSIRILGRGIVDGSDYDWCKGPYECTIGIEGRNIEVNGITVRGSSHWTIVPRNSHHVVIRNVKLCNSRVQNDDGINPCNSQDVLITDCFIRSDDDCVAMKGLANDAGAAGNVENVTVENCVLWCDRARIFLLGHESRAPYMRRIRLRNLDIIHYAMTPFLFEPGEEMRLEDVLIENVRIHGEGQQDFVRLKPTVNQYMKTKAPGHVTQVVFRNVQLTGAPGGYRIQLKGADSQHGVRHVKFEDVSILGKPLTDAYPNLSIDSNVEDAQFVQPICPFIRVN